MKGYMRYFMAAMAVLFLTAYAASAQEVRQVNKCSVQKGGLSMLEQDLQKVGVPGIAESSLYAIIEVKALYPDLDYSRVLGAVRKLEKESGDPALKYKAYLVSMYLDHSSEIQVEPKEGAIRHDYLFKQIADQLETRFLAYSDEEAHTDSLR